MARQVVQDLPEYDPEEDLSDQPFWRRHERLVLPICVMVTTLLFVAFGPILLS